MKKIKSILISSIALFLICSCASTPEVTSEKKSENHKSHTSKTAAAVETPEDKFIKSLEGISIKSTGTPKEVTNGRSFSTPFTFQVTAADGSALADFPVTISYPESKSEGKINFAKENLKTDENGNISFTPKTTSFAAKSKITAYPTKDFESETISERLQPYSAEAVWKVKSDIASKGAVLFVWDFNEKDRPVNNSYNIQAEFRSRGITMVGNGPVNETSYIGKPKSLYKDTYDIIGGNQYGYLLYGTIKFAEPVTALEDESGYYCIMKAEIEAVSMKDGSKIYSAVTTYESKGKNWNECVSKGKDKLSELVVDDIMYGL